MDMDVDVNMDMDTIMDMDMDMSMDMDMDMGTDADMEMDRHEPPRLADWEDLCRHYTKMFCNKFNNKEKFNRTDIYPSKEARNSEFRTWNFVKLLFSECRGI